MKAKIADEPVFTSGAIVAAIMAFLVMLANLNVFSLMPEQLESINTFLIVSVPLILGGALVARRYVKPMAKINRGE